MLLERWDFLRSPTPPPPNVKMVHFLSSISGFNLPTILPHVTFLSFRTCIFGMKITVFVTFPVLVPWTNCPSSFEKYCPKTFLSRPLTICLFYWATPDIWWVTVSAFLTCRNFSANAKFGKVFFLQLDLKLDLGPPVSTLRGCAGNALDSDIGTSGRMICGPEEDMWKLSWKSVWLLPLSSSMMLGRSKGKGVARVGRNLWGIGADLVIDCFGGGSNGCCRLAATLEKILESFSISTIWEPLILENGAWGAGFCRA